MTVQLVNSQVVVQPASQQVVVQVVQGLPGRSLNNRGNWVTATPYAVLDFFRDPATNKLYSVLIAHTSTSVAADLAAGKINEMLNITQIEALRDEAVTKAGEALASADASEVSRLASGASADASEVSRLASGVSAAASEASKVISVAQADTATAQAVIATAQALVATNKAAEAAASAASVVRDGSGGVAGLTLFKLNLRNAADTLTSFLTNTATVARTWTMPDKDGTVAMISDVDIAAQTHSATSKTTPVDADEFGGADSEATFGLKKYSWSNIKAALKTYFDTIYGKSYNADGLTHLLHPTLDGNFRDTYRAGALPAWFNQQWGGAQWGGLPDGSFGSVATGNVQDDSVIDIGNVVETTANSAGFQLSEAITSPVIWVKVLKLGNPTDNLQISVYSNGASIPSAIIGSIGSIAGKQISSKVDGEWYGIAVTSGALSANTQYHVVVNRSGGLDATNYYQIKRTIRNKYPLGQRSVNNAGTWGTVAGQQLCFLIENPAANSLIQPGGVFGNYKLAFNPGNPVNQSRSLAQPLSQFYDGKECSVIHRGTYAVSSNVWDFAYGLDHDRITVTVNASGYPVLSIYEADRTLHQVTGASAITTGNHDVAIKVRTVGDGADYAYLYVDGVSVGTPLTAQTFTMSKEMRDLGTARLGDGFGIIPAWTQDMQMTSLPSAQGWTWAGTATEANAMSIQGGKLYQNANGYTSTQSGYYTKTTTFNNTTGWTFSTRLRVPFNSNTPGGSTGALRLAVSDGSKGMYLEIAEHFCTMSSGSLVVIQNDFKLVDNILTLQGKGSDIYLFINGKLVIDGTGLFTQVSAANNVYFGDTTATSLENSDAIWSYIKYYTGGMILPIANNKDCSEFAHWSGDKSALFAPLWNAGAPVSVKQLCGVEKNYIGEGVVQKEERLGLVLSPTTTIGSMTTLADMECYILGESLSASSIFQATNSGNAYVTGDISVDGVPIGPIQTYWAATATANGEISLNQSKGTYRGLHKVSTLWGVSANTGTSSLKYRNIIVEAKS